MIEYVNFMKCVTLRILSTEKVFSGISLYRLLLRFSLGLAIYYPSTSDSRNYSPKCAKQCMREMEEIPTKKREA